MTSFLLLAVASVSMHFDASFRGVPAGVATFVTAASSLEPGCSHSATLSVRGGFPFFRIRDTYTSYFDPLTFASCRFVRDVNEGGYSRNETFFLSAPAPYSSRGELLEPVVLPLDDASLLMYVRSLDFSVPSVSVSRYYRSGRTISIRLRARQVMSTSIGRFKVLVVDASVPDRRGASHDVTMWLSDTPEREILRLTASLPWGELVLTRTR